MVGQENGGVHADEPLRRRVVRMNPVLERTKGPAENAESRSRGETPRVVANASVHWIPRLAHGNPYRFIFA